MAPSATGRPYSSSMATPSSSSNLAGLTAAFRAVAYVEAATYLVLLACVVLYRILDGPDFIGIMGPIHGIAFLVYLMLVLRIRESQGWGFWRTIAVIVASAVPLGGFWAGRDVVEQEAAPSSP
jgi:integral membrane protein